MSVTVHPLRKFSAGIILGGVLGLLLTVVGFGPVAVILVCLALGLYVSDVSLLTFSGFLAGFVPVLFLIVT